MSPESLILDWLRDPTKKREQQKTVFLQILRAWGLPDGILVEEIHRCVMKAWVNEGPTFGKLLCERLDYYAARLAFPEFQGDPAMLSAQQAFPENFQRAKAKLMEMDVSS